MKKYNFGFLASFTLVLHLVAQPLMLLQPVDDPEQPDIKNQLIWSTEPGIRYALQRSTDLSDPEAWEDVAGYPSEATALAQQKLLGELAEDIEYYRVVKLDEQAPTVVKRTPEANSFGVRRFFPLSIELEDITGVSPDSLLLTVGGHGPFILADEELSYSGGVLTLDLGGDSALGAYGETIQVSLTVADTEGNNQVYNWTFELERETVVADNVFVFGSPSAQRTGQRLVGASATLAARMNAGPVRMNGAVANWSIHSVLVDRIIIQYDGDVPVFTVGQKLANLAPAHEDEIFYRLVSQVENDPANLQVILHTTDLSLADMLQDASFQIPGGAVILDMDAEGTLVPNAAINATLQLPTLGADFSGTSYSYDVEVVDPDAGTSSTESFELSLTEAKILFTPYLDLDVDVDSDGVKRFNVRARGEMEIACVPQLGLSAGFSVEKEQELWKGAHWVWFTVGVVPVGIEIGASVTAHAAANIDTSATVKTGFRQDSYFAVSGDYVRGASPLVQWDREFDIRPFQTVPLTYTLDGGASASLSLVPQVDVRLYGGAGLYVNVDPRLVVSGSITTVNSIVSEANWSFGAYADLNAGLSVIGFTNDQLPALPPFRLFTYEWGDNYVNETITPDVPLAITRNPVSQNAKIGDTVLFSVDATGSGNIRYQWYHNDVMFPGATSKILTLNSVGIPHEGTYSVSIKNETQSIETKDAILSVIATNNTSPASAGMVRIPAGWFTMGRTSGDTDSDAPPVNVYVSEFYMARNEVTWTLWTDVRDWAVDHGYTDIATGAGKAATHPVQKVSWLDVVKWCNARSEREGLIPVYRDSDISVFKTGTTDPTANWNANGYRLPTEAEWEKAARGGVSGQRFPWGDTITHSQANYYSTTTYNYDINSTWEYHPTYNDGTTPFTSPVGSFAVNGYGLYDMTGSILEWCWDSYSASTYTEGVRDPTGAPTNSVRVCRGGCWYRDARQARSAGRTVGNRDARVDRIGFRPARSSVP